MSSIRIKSLRFKEIALLVSVSIITLVIGEVILILFDKYDPLPRYDVGDCENSAEHYFKIDNKIGWKMKANTKFSWDSSEWESDYLANEQGFRSPTFKSDEQRRKIVLIGDSYTFGSFVNFDETFGAIIDNKNAEYVVYNLAMPGFGVDQMLLTLRHYVLDLTPELVIVGLCDFDFERSLTAYRFGEKRTKPVFKLEKGDLRLKTIEDRTNWLIRFFDRHSRIYTCFKGALRRLGYRFPIGDWWILNRAIIDKIHKIGKENNINVMYIYLPTREWNNFPMLEKHMKGNNYDFINIHKSEIDNPLKLYYKTDRHFNPYGHQFVAKEIQKYIRSTINP